MWRVGREREREKERGQEMALGRLREMEREEAREGLGREGVAAEVVEEERGQEGWAGGATEG